jgi:hypothetical protein
VNNWVSHGEGFPEPVENDETAALIQERAHERGADPEYRDRKAVLTWYLNQPFSVARRGPKDTVALALAAVPKATRLSVAQLTTELGLKEKKTVYYWAQTPESRPGDPFPPADSGSKREWAAVRSWLLRKDDPVPEDAEELEAWVLRYAEHVGPGSYLTDENGLTMGQRDAVERARVARAAGHGFGSRRLAQLLGLPTAKVSDLLARDGSPLPASHLFPAALAEELGVDAKRLSHFARYYKTGEDPFPPSVSGRGYEVEAARDWLQRRGLLTGEDTTDPQD